MNCTNLPVALTSFVGRDADLSHLRRLLREDRIVTLAGPGGCGKTRLAVEAARALLDGHPDGAWFVDLSSLTGRGLVVSTVAQTVRLSRHGPPDLEGLVAWLGEKQVLLILDNCEHLVQEAAAVAEALVRGCWQLRLLATSREPLGVEGERVFRVGALSEPDAVRLFVDRAQHADAAFQLDVARPSVEAICRRLDSMPLALELAAAHAAAMAPAQILERLDKRFRLLVGGRSRVSRHQTLRATVEWSEALLSEPERRLFRRLGVFVDGFDLEAAEAVAGGPDLPAEEVLVLLKGLVERSLVQFDQGEGRGRYRLLETLREHALGRLVEADEARRMREAHAAHYMQVARRQDQLSPHVDWALMLKELGNLRAALQNTQSSGSALFAPLAAWLGIFFLGSAWQGEGRSWMEAALATEPDDLYIHFRLAWGLGMLANLQGDVSAALQYGRMALANCEERSDKVGTARVLSNLAANERMAGDQEAALGYAQRALRLARETGDKLVLRLALAELAATQVDAGDLEGALVAARESVALATVIGEPILLRNCLNLLVRVHRTRGEVDTALAVQRDAICVDQPYVFEDLMSLANMVDLLTVTAHHESAVRLAGAVESNDEQLGFKVTHAAYFREALAQAVQALGPRATHIRESGQRMSIEEAKAFALREPGTDPFPGVRLTRREVEVARLVRAGMTDAQIGKKLFISARTAESHMESVRNKLGVSTRAEVAAWVAVQLPAEETP